MLLPSSARGCRPGPQRPSARPRLEALEDRVVPAASLDFGDVFTYPELINSSTATKYHLYGVDQAFDLVGNRYVLANARPNADPSVEPQAFLARFTPSDTLDAAFGDGGLVHFSDYMRGIGLASDGSGNVYVALDEADDGPTTTGFDVLKLDATGVALQSYHETRDIGTGLRGEEFDLATGAAGSVYYTSGGTGTVKLESTDAGLVELARYSVGGSALAVDLANGHLYVVGGFAATAFDFDPYGTYADNRDILSTGAKGKYGTGPGSDMFVLELGQTATGGLAYAWAGRYDWGSNYDLAEDVAVSTSGIYVYGRNTAGLSAFLFKLANPAGATTHALEWSRTLRGLGGTGTGDGKLTLDGQGNVYAAAWFEAGVDLDLGASYAGDWDRIVLSTPAAVAASYTASGDFRWAAAVTGEGGAEPFGVGVGADGKVRLAATSTSYTTVFSPDTQRTNDWAGVAVATYSQTETPMAYARGVSKAEGSSGTTAFQFEVRLTQASTQPVTVSYSTANGTATAVSDYTGAGGTLTFAAGETSKTVTVNVVGDTAIEADETFYLDLSVLPGTDVVAGTTRVAATIVNDDVKGGKRLVADSSGTSAGLAPLSASQIEPLWQEALARWQAAGYDTSALANVTVRVRDLGGSVLGMATGNVVWVDDDAAGWGWFVDATPRDDSEFTTAGDQGEQGRMDLLSALMHEMGHLLGHEHETDGVMQETLAAGTRQLPEAEHHGGHRALDLVFSGQAGQPWDAVVVSLLRKLEQQRA